MVPMDVGGGRGLVWPGGGVDGGNAGPGGILIETVILYVSTCLMCLYMNMRRVCNIMDGVPEERYI